MRNSKNTRTCKGCFEKFDKKNHDMIAICYDNKNNNYMVYENQEEKKQGLGRSLYICKNNKCIDKAITKNTIAGYIRKKLDKKTIEKLEDIKGKLIN